MTGAQPCPYRARAWWADELVGESTGAVRVDHADGPPDLFFPRADVRLARGGLARDGDGELTGFVAFDDERVRLELVDARVGDEPRDVTIKAFPTWGDATDLVAVLDVQPDGDGRYLGAVRSGWQRPVVDGSQMLGQAIVAAGRSTSGRRPVSASMVFSRAADARLPTAIELESVASGRTFTTLAARAMQSGRVCATGTLLLDQTAADVIRHGVEPPDVPGPYDSVPVDMSVTGRDIRIVDNAYTGDPDAPVGPPVLDAWVRFRELPPDPSLHAGLLAQFTGHLSIAAALRPHAGIGQDQAHHRLSTAINAITLSIHGDVRADRWLLYHHRATFAGDGMIHTECRVHDENGALMASFTVDAMIRAFADPDAPHDGRTAM